jgi:hypothetical protein
MTGETFRRSCCVFAQGAAPQSSFSRFRLHAPCLHAVDEGRTLAGAGARVVRRRDNKDNVQMSNIWCKAAHCPHSTHSTSSCRQLGAATLTRVTLAGHAARKHMDSSRISQTRDMAASYTHTDCLTAMHGLKHAVFALHPAVCAKLHCWTDYIHSAPVITQVLQDREHGSGCLSIRRLPGAAKHSYLLQESTTDRAEPLGSTRTHSPALCIYAWSHMSCQLFGHTPAPGTSRTCNSSPTVQLW